jgi:hypothetical protein
MPRFTELGVHYGGQSLGAFDQSHYIRQFPAHLRGGCCMTLCCCWIVSKGNLNSFKTFIASKTGTNMVKGFQGLATKASGPASDLGGYFIGYINEIYRIFGIRFMGEVALGNARDAAQVAKFVGNKQAFYQLHFQSNSDNSGHAIAFQNTSGTLQVFDPNDGTMEFGGSQRGGQFDFMLSKLLRDFYPNLAGRWDAVRAYFP